MPQQIQSRRGTAAAWTTANTVLAAGELGFETDTLKGKFGDGATTWTSLAYAFGPAASPIHVIPLAPSDETTALTTGTAKITFRMPYAFTLTGVRASVTTAATGATLLTIDINQGGTTFLSTKLTFDAGEKTTVTSVTPAVISDTTLDDDAEITVDIDAVGNTIAGAGLKVYLIGYKT